MGKTNRLTTEEFIKRARKIQGDKYDYSKVEYKNNKTKVCIICPKHGEFWQKPDKHLIGQGCPKCGGTSKKNIAEFIEKVRKIHNDKYDYSKVNYVNNRVKVCIICPEHGEFYQKPDSHLIGQGCPKCAQEKRNSKKFSTQDEFIKKAKKVHGDKYDYSNVKYVRSNKEVCIICPEHGEFWQKPVLHVQGNGCHKCGLIKKAKSKTLSNDEFIKKCKEKNILEKIEILEPYINYRTKLKCKCKRCDHEWFVTAQGILAYRECPECNHFGGKEERNLYESLKLIFKDDIIIHIYHNKHILGKQEIDIFFPKYNIGIEYQGSQHFEPNDIMGGEKEFKNVLERDIRKYNILKENNIILLYFMPPIFKNTNISIYHHNNSYTKLDKLVNRIKKEIQKKRE